MKYIVDCQMSRASHTIVGEADSVEDAKQLAERHAGVNELIWSYSFVHVWWSNEKEGGELIDNTYHIFEVE